MDFVRFEVRLPIDTRTKLREAAKKDHRSMHSYILKCIDCCLEYGLVEMRGKCRMMPGNGGLTFPGDPPSSP